MKSLLLSILIILSLTALSCKKDRRQLPADVPVCFEEILEREQAGGGCIDPDRLEEYEFQGSKVYIFTNDAVCPDLSTPIYNENCEVVCTLGGMTGNMVCNGDTFYKHSVFVRYLWVKPE